MDWDQEREKIAAFVKAGLVTLSALLLIVTGFYYLPKSVSTMKKAGNQRELPIYCVDTKENKVALTFDAAWGNTDTKKILEILERHKVHAAFFMTGGWIETYPDDVKAIAAAGHDLGNHSESHKEMSQLSKAQCMEEIKKPHKRVKELTGREMILFRPPYGDYNNTLLEAAGECGYYCIQWDVDSLDWKDYGAESIINTVLCHPHLSNGSIILCHNGAKFTPEALDRLITGLKEKGLEIVPLTQLIYTGEYGIDQQGRQFEK